MLWSLLRRRVILLKVVVALVCMILVANVVWIKSISPSLKPKSNLAKSTASSTAALKTTDVPSNQVFRMVRYKLTSQELQSLANKSTHVLSLEEPYLSRHTGIRKRCRHVMNDEVEFSQMIYDDKYRFVMCDVAKGASTTWRYIIWYLLGKVDSQVKLKGFNIGDIVLNRGNMPVLGRLNHTEALKRLQTYATFVVMRHPFSRLVSAYSSKLTPRNPENVYKMRFGRPIAIAQASSYMHGIVVNKETNISRFDVKSEPKFKKLSKGEKSDVLKYIEIIKSGEISFPQFAKFVANTPGNLRYVDMHWRPQTSICNPCAVNYDYIINFEDLNKDSDRILEYLQREDPAEKQIRMKPRKSLINNNRTTEYLNMLDAETKERLRRFYKQDFAVYSYT